MGQYNMGRHDVPDMGETLACHFTKRDRIFGPYKHFEVPVLHVSDLSDSLTSKETPSFQIMLDNVSFIFDNPIICKTWIDQSDTHLSMYPVLNIISLLVIGKMKI
jgi:hypothetical protein